MQVVTGGALDVDFVITGPNGGIILQRRRQTEGLYEGKASQNGDYEVRRIGLIQNIFLSNAQHIEV